MKKKLLVGVFLLIIFGGLVTTIVLPDLPLSYSERRTLRQLPHPSVREVMSGEWSEKLESYLLDQFPARDTFRAIKANMLYRVLRQSDNNGIYLGEDGHVFKIDYPLNEKSVERFAAKLNTLYEKYLKNANVYYAIIPDKARFSKAAKKHLLTDWDRQMQILAEHIDSSIGYIPLLDVLTLDDYYRTDLHWRQECLSGVAGRLGKYLGFETTMEGLNETEYSPFFGAYYGQSALSPRPDTLKYLTGGAIESAEVEYHQHSVSEGVYRPDKLGGMDSYDVYLSGAKPLITIHNTQSVNGRSLIIFRDSFTSSLAPLLIEAYETITLIDLRYLSSEIIDQYVDFAGHDVLFLYGEQILNHSEMLR